MATRRTSGKAVLTRRNLGLKGSPMTDNDTMTAIAERFKGDTAGHEMTVLHDDGLYRHLRFRRPDRGSYWFDLITWPGCLTVNGDCGAFTFARTEDMFEFFRGHRVNPMYWAEKIRGETRVKSYSEDRFRQLVTEDIEDAERNWPGLAAAVEQDIFGDRGEWSTYYEEGAREALASYEHGASFTAACSCGDCLEGATDHDAQAWRVSHIKSPDPGGHSSKVTRVGGFRFSNTWEWDLSDYDWTFLWCCHAIVWGIGLYDAQKADDSASAVVASP
jgi:hypothetical protein